MLKRITAILASVAILGVPVLADSYFTDLPESHWGYESVSKLSTDGTISGYPDGTFLPDNMVTRAEFVKMMGVGEVLRDTEFKDVDKSHWGYDSIMTSEFNANDNLFMPDEPILRREVIDLLWKRAGRMDSSDAPSIITDQYADNKQAVAWAYGYGIIKGDDGLKLRLSDPISRVEAAALIVRTRETDFEKPRLAFADVVSDNLLKTIFESFNLFNSTKEYSPEQTVTNGELARAALRVASYEMNMTYSSYVYQKPFDHEYGVDLYIIANRCFGDNFVTEEFIDKTALTDDAVAALSFAGIQRSIKPVSFGNVNRLYKDIPADIDSKKNVFLTYAYENGIRLNADGTIGAGKPVTHKDIAALLLQIDYLVGTQTIVTTQKDAKGRYTKYDARLNHDVSSYPSNADKFKCIIADIPNFVYEKEISGKNPSETFDFAREYSEMIVTHIDKMVAGAKSQYGIDIMFTIYPNLFWDNGRQFQARMKCTVLGVSGEPESADTIFGSMLMEPIEGDLEEGMSFFVEVTTSYAIF